jgi:hypothetical protein
MATECRPKGCKGVRMRNQKLCKICPNGAFWGLSTEDWVISTTSASLLYLAPPPQIWLELSPYTTLLEELSVEITPILTILFNKSVTTGIVPSDWRTTNVSPVTLVTWPTLTGSHVPRSGPVRKGSGSMFCACPGFPRSFFLLVGKG